MFRTGMTNDQTPMTTDPWPALKVRRSPVKRWERAREGGGRGTGGNPPPL